MKKNAALSELFVVKLSKMYPHTLLSLYSCVTMVKQFTFEIAVWTGKRSKYFAVKLLRW